MENELKQKQIEEMAKEIARVLFEIRQDMTSVTRYIRHKRRDGSTLSPGQLLDRHLEYKDLADEASKNILKNLNENDKLKEVENLCVKIGRFGFTENAVVLTREEYETLKNNQMPLHPITLTAKQYTDLKLEAVCARKETAEQWYKQVTIMLLGLWQDGIIPTHIYNAKIQTCNAIAKQFDVDIGE